MPEKSLSEVSSGVRESFEKGLAALHRENLDYALSLLGDVCRLEPGLYPAREALRAAQLRKASGQTSFFRKVLSATNPSLAKAQFALRSNPLEAIHSAEQILQNDPQNTTAHRILAQAALTLGFHKTAVLSLDLVHKQNPTDKTASLQFAEALAAAGQVARAETILGDLLRIHPNDPAIAQALKNISARRTLDEGGYGALEGGQGSYRDILKNENEARSLEQEHRQVKSPDVAARLIHDQEQRLAQDPRNPRLIRSLADLQANNGSLNEAIILYQRLLADSEGADPGLEKIISDLQARRITAAIEALDPAAPDHAARLSELQTERELFLINEARQRVERYPNDLQLRYELGVLCFQANRLTEAIQEFQKAQNNPHRRIASLNLLGQCFARRGMNDLAVRTLQNALKEKVGFDEERKEVLYHLGVVLDKMGLKAESIEQFKLIYESDIGYRDVAARVDAFYSSQAG